jgi:AcrR family transcriptional regulator
VTSRRKAPPLHPPEEEPEVSRRAVHAAATRERLLAAATAFFEEHPASELTLPKLARLAGVTPPTAYANFGTVESLMRSLYEWVLPRLGTRDALPAPSRLHEIPAARFPRFEAHAGLLRAIWTSGSWSGHRSRTRSSYVEAALENLQAASPRLTRHDALLALGPVMAFAYPPMWQWLRDVMGLSRDEAEAAASWAMKALVVAAGRSPPRLAKKAPPRPTAPRSRRGGRARAR